MYDGPAPASGRHVAPGVTANLERHGLTPEVTRGAGGDMVCITGRLSS